MSGKSGATSGKSKQVFDRGIETVEGTLSGQGAATLSSHGVNVRCGPSRHFGRSEIAAITVGLQPRPCCPWPDDVCVTSPRESWWRWLFLRCVTHFTKYAKLKLANPSRSSKVSLLNEVKLLAVKVIDWNFFICHTSVHFSSVRCKRRPPFDYFILCCRLFDENAHFSM